jgi:hypothetical protein
MAIFVSKIKQIMDYKMSTRGSQEPVSFIALLYKLCVFFYVDRNSKMTTTAGNSFYIGPIGSFDYQVNDTGS